MVSKKITADFKRKFLENKTARDSVNQAIKIAKSNGVEGEELQALVVLKQQHTDVLANGQARILRSMNLSSNIVELGNSWYGIRYLDDKHNTALKLELLNEEDLHILERDGRKERELGTAQVHTLILSCINYPLLDAYKELLKERSKEYLTSTMLGIDKILTDHAEVQQGTLHAPMYGLSNMPEEPKALVVTEDTLMEGAEGIEGTTKVSFHAGVRYVQRVLFIGVNNEVQAQKHFKAHAQDVTDELLLLFNSSEVIWNEVQGDEEITYYVDKDNNVFVVGSNTIITMYVADFGFSKEINHMIVIKQSGVLYDVRNAWNKVQATQREEISAISEEVSQIDDVIQELEIRISRELSRKTELQLTAERVNKDAEVAKAEFTKEFNKLFKKWKN